MQPKRASILSGVERYLLTARLFAVVDRLGSSRVKLPAEFLGLTRQNLIYPPLVFHPEHTGRQLGRDGKKSADLRLTATCSMLRFASSIATTLSLLVATSSSLRSHPPLASGSWLPYRLPEFDTIHFRDFHLFDPARNVSIPNVGPIKRRPLPSPTQGKLLSFYVVADNPLRNAGE